MKLYHGSYQEIEAIDLSKSKPNKDFGKGFYLSAEIEQATAMAAYKAAQMDSSPIVTAFEFDENMLSEPSSADLKIKVFNDYSEDWAKFVFANRNNPTGAFPIHDYDIVYGPIANDKVGVQIRNYIENNISFQTFIERIKYLKGVTFQYYFGTEKAIKLLKKI